MFIIIILLTLTTLIPRVIPLLLASKINKVPKSVDTFLLAIPYAAIGVLIFPNILTVTQIWWHGALVGIVALCFIIYRVNIFLVLAISVAMIYFLN